MHIRIISLTLIVILILSIHPIKVEADPFSLKPNLEKSNINPIFFISLVIIIFIIFITYNRIQKTYILANARRKTIYELIEKNPSIHFREIMRTLSLKPGSLAYHLNVLEKGKFIISIQKGEFRCFYPFNTKNDMKIILSNIQQKIIFMVCENPGISLTELSKALYKSKMVIWYNTHILEDVGIINQKKKGRIVKYYLNK